jgi:hypothetical protein
VCTHNVTDSTTRLGEGELKDRSSSIDVDSVVCAGEIYRGRPSGGEYAAGRLAKVTLIVNPRDICEALESNRE